MKLYRALRSSPCLALGLLLACDPLPGDTDGTESATSTSSGTVASTGDASGDSGTLDPSASSTAGTGGGACQPLPQQGDPCMLDTDCEISGDCCSCVAYNPNIGAPGNCGGGCGATVCDQLGLVEGYCDAGACRVRGLSCDQTAVQCDTRPPECPQGELPQVAEQCYTGACLPVMYCDWVPDCSYCPDGEHCVITQTAGCDQHSCIPPFPECPAGPPTCDCLGQVACEAPYSSCEIGSEGVICS